MLLLSFTNNSIFLYRLFPILMDFLMPNSYQVSTTTIDLFRNDYDLFLNILCFSPKFDFWSS